MTDAKDCFSADESKIPTGGARRDRTDDLLLAKQALSQLSYGPSRDQYQMSVIRSNARVADDRPLITDA
jgi:hypothetical protein